MISRTKILIIAWLVVTSAALPAQQTPARSVRPWMNSTIDPAERADLLITEMTAEEKIRQIAMNPVANTSIPGCGLSRNGRHIEGIRRLGIPTVRMTNAPAGVVGGDCEPNPPATSLPDQLAATASWDRRLWSSWGDIVGNETRATAHTIVLTPGINLGRIPNNGRNFEYAGEDPFLAGTFAVEVAKSIQRHGVLATGKHFVGNEQETDRTTMNVVIDDRTLHELYLLPFEMAIKDGDLAAVMCSYPRINGVYACEDEYTLNTVLREQWGFKGFVMSDRGATNSTVPSIRAGNDLEFANAKYFTEAAIKEAVASGQLNMNQIDTMLKRHFYMMFKFGQFDSPITGFRPIDFARHGQSSREMAEEGAVLLKNKGGLLPLSAASIRSVAIIGPSTFAGKAVMGGNGPRSDPVRSSYTISPEEGLQGTLASLGSAASVNYNDARDIGSAAALAAASDVAIVIVGDRSIEGRDRPNLELPTIDDVDQNALVSAIAKANPRTVVVLKNGGPVLMPWLDQVTAVLEAWYPGQEDGKAIANLLFGVTNPSGKLPITFPAGEREAAASTPSQWPGVPANSMRTATYSEGLNMGYRWYEANNRKPTFPFGYGLSYTSFELSNLVVTPRVTDGRAPIHVQFSVRNKGSRPGAEVPQLYVGFPSAAGEPPKRLVAFDKVTLAPGQSKRVVLTIDPTASNHPLSIWNSTGQRWVTLNGQYRVYVGNSSADISLRGVLAVRTAPRRKPG